MKERFVAQGIDLASNTPEAFGHLNKSEVPRWRQIVKDAGAKWTDLCPVFRHGPIQTFALSRSQISKSVSSAA